MKTTLVELSARALRFKIQVLSFQLLHNKKSLSVTWCLVSGTADEKYPARLSLQVLYDRLIIYTFPLKSKNISAQ